MMKWSFVFFLVVLHIAKLVAQTGDENADRILDSAKHYIYSDKIKAYRFAASLKEKATVTRNDIAAAYAHHILGIIDEKHGDNEAAFDNYTTAITYAEKSGDVTVKLRVMIALSNYYSHRSQTDKSIELCHQGINEAVSIGDKEILAQFYNNLSLVHSYIKDYDMALEYNDKSIELKKESGDEQSLANAYLNKGLMLTEMGRYEEGFKNYSLAEEIHLKHNTYHALTQTHINFGWDYTDLKQFKKAREHLEKALHYAEKSDDKIREAGAWNALGYYYKNAGFNDSVAYALKKGLQLSLEAENKRNALTAYQELSDYYHGIGKLNLAYEHLNNAFKLKDTIFEESKIQLTQSLNARYEAGQKEEEINLLNAQKENDSLTIQKQRWILLSILLFITVLSILFYTLFIHYRKKQKLKKIQELQSQKEAERIRIARDMHDEIGAGLTRIVMRSEQVKMRLHSSSESKEGIMETLEKMSTESREISHNIGEIIWALNPKNDTLDNLFAYIRNYAFDYLEEANIAGIIHYPDSIPVVPVAPELRRNVFLIIKESLNNIVKHSKATEAIVELTLSAKHFSLKIQDNGTGITNSVSTIGNGLGNMKKRTEDLGGNFSFFSFDEEKGVVISLEQVPY